MTFHKCLGEALWGLQLCCFARGAKTWHSSCSQVINNTWKDVGGEKESKWAIGYGNNCYYKYECYPTSWQRYLRSHHNQSNMVIFTELSQDGMVTHRHLCVEKIWNTFFSSCSHLLNNSKCKFACSITAYYKPFMHGSRAQKECSVAR